DNSRIMDKGACVHFFALFCAKTPTFIVEPFIYRAVFLRDENIALNFVVFLIYILFLFLFELWILFILRKVYPKTKENLLKKLEGKS
ncbi:hypothetical protein P4657_04570, partial [Halalkalibacterium halodurans]